MARVTPATGAEIAQTTRQSESALVTFGPPLGLALAGLLAFSPGLGAGFVSDGFYFLWRAHIYSFTDALGYFVPSNSTWYRPLTDLIFWLEYHLFGLNPVGYHIFALSWHVASAVLVFFITLRLVRSRIGAGLAALVLLLSIHAHEVVLDTADLHNALGGAALLGCVLAYICGRRAISLFLGALTFLIDETGTLLLPLLALYEVLLPGWDEVSNKRKVGPAIASGLIRLAPFAVLLVAYVLWRTVLTSTGFYNETVPCHSFQCITNGLMEYVNRLFWRPDAVLALIWDQRGTFARAALVIVGIIVLFSRPWTWKHWRVALFAVGWIVGSILYFVLALWEYITDRFLYIPDMGLALLIGVVSAEIINRWSLVTRGVGSLFRKTADALVVSVFVLWLIVGAIMLFDRGTLWARSGEEARSLVEQVHDLVPQPPPSVLFVVRNLPDSYYRQIPPGNSGPYLFRNGFDHALELRYGRADVWAYREGGKRPELGAVPEILLSIENGRVQVVGRQNGVLVLREWRE